MDIQRENDLLYDELVSLKEIEANFIFFLKHTSDYIYFKDINHSFTYASDTFAALTNHSSWRELVGKNDFDIFPEEHAKMYYEREKPIMQEGKELMSVEEPYYDKEGNECWVSSSKKPIYNKKNEIIGLFGISRDITQVKMLKEELTQKAHYDSLTRLFNRAFFLQQSTKYLNLAKRNHQEIALFYIDLDHFKLINDQYGHLAGDSISETVSKRLRKGFRNSDLIGRMGGDEFVLLAFFDGEQESLEKISEHIIEAITRPIQFNDIELEVGCSVGISHFPEHGDTIDALIAKADTAMYVAKKTQRNSSVLFASA